MARPITPTPTLKRLEALQFMGKMDNVQSMTYEQLDALLAVQDRLVLEGKMAKPTIKYGFTPRQRWEFNNGISIEDYTKKHKIFDCEESCPVG